MPVVTRTARNEAKAMVRNALKTFDDSLALTLQETTNEADRAWAAAVIVEYKALTETIRKGLDTAP